MYPDLKLNVGSSYWYSDIENKDNSETGHRNAWALFSKINYKNANITLTAGKNKVSNHDVLGRDYSVIGSFDSSYNLANEGDFYTADINYVFKDVLYGWSLTPMQHTVLCVKTLKILKLLPEIFLVFRQIKGIFLSRPNICSEKMTRL